MSLAAICWWTLVRTLVLCLLAWPVCRWIERAFHHLSWSRRPWLLVAVLAPCCFPELLVGYAFRDIALAKPRWAEALCAGLLFVRMVPVGAIALLAAPRSALDAAAIHCRRMAFRSRFGSHYDWVELAWCFWHGPIVRALPALALMSLVAFQEFEMAALLQTMSWTDWFVTHQQLGLDRGELLRQAIWPLLWQMPVLLGVLHWLRTVSDGPDGPDTRAGPGNHFATRVESVVGPANRSVAWLGIGCVAIAVIAGCLIPVTLIGWRTVDGLVLLSRQRSQQWGMAREIITSGSIAVCASLSAWTVSRWLKSILAYGLLPGLFGSLLLSLGCVTLFQISWLRPLYDTPIPWVLALTVWLLPRAAILRMWLHAMRSDEAIHVAELLGGSFTADAVARDRRSPFGQRLKSSLGNLRWQLRDQPRFLALGLLGYWAYCDLPSAYLLAPTGMASGLVRLYNFMHFGRSAALSAEASVFFGLPVVCLFLLLILNRRTQRGLHLGPVIPAKAGIQCLADVEDKQLDSIPTELDTEGAP
jgi:hypothetical protein